MANAKPDATPTGRLSAGHTPDGTTRLVDRLAEVVHLAAPAAAPIKRRRLTDGLVTRESY